MAADEEQSFNKCLKKEVPPGAVTSIVTPSQPLAGPSLWGSSSVFCRHNLIQNKKQQTQRYREQTDNCQRRGWERGEMGKKDEAIKKNKTK